MTNRTAATSPRTVRTLAASAIASGAALLATVTGAVPAGAAGNTAAGSTSPGSTAPPAAAAPAVAATTTAPNADLEVQAQELVGQINADGRQLDELDAAYQGALIRLGQLDAEEAATRRAMASAAAAEAVAHRQLEEQAVLAYMAGGSPIISYVPNRPGQDPSLTLAYAEIVAGGQKQAEDAYRATLAEQTRQAATLAGDVEQAGVTLADIRYDRSQATATLTSQQAALSQVKGQLAVEVARVQVEQQQQEATTEKATLTAEGQLPPAGPAPAAAGPDSAGPGSAVSGLAGPTATHPGSPSTVARSTSTYLRSTTTSSTTGLSTTTSSTSTARSDPTTSDPAAATSTTTLPTASTAGGTGGTGSPGAQAPGASTAIAYAQAQLGKPYQWAGAGPDSFDCSGLVMMAWAQAGVQFPHLAQDQYDMTARVAVADLEPGDLVFFGTPTDVYHVGIYVGNGQMIDAPETGQDVSVQSIYWDSLLGGGRVES